MAWRVFAPKRHGAISLQKTKFPLLKCALLMVGITAAFAAGARADGLATDAGAPVGDNQNSQTAGPGGPVLLQDSHLIEKLQRFDLSLIHI